MSGHSSTSPHTPTDQLIIDVISRNTQRTASNSIYQEDTILNTELNNERRFAPPAPSEVFGRLNSGFNLEVNMTPALDASLTLESTLESAVSVQATVGSVQVHQDEFDLEMELERRQDESVFAEVCRLWGWIGCRATWRICWFDTLNSLY